MSLTFTNAEEVTKDSVLIAGRNKTGKTTLAAQWPEPIIINTDPNIAALRDLQLPMWNVERMTPENKKSKDKLMSFKDVRKLLVSLRDQEGPFWDELQKADYLPETVILDSVSSLSDLMESEIIVNPPIDQNGKIEGGQRYEALQRQDYNRVQRRLFGILDLFRNLPYHRVATCWIDLSQDDMNRLVYQPAVTGSKLGPKVPHFFNEIYLLSVEEKNHEGEIVLTCIPTRKAAFPGTLYKSLRGQTIVDPSYEKLKAFYEEVKKGKSS